MSSEKIITSDENPKIEPGIARQLYQWYPIIGGCPHCGFDELIGVPSDQQLKGISNEHYTNCPHCKKGINLQICYKTNAGKGVVDSLTKFRPRGTFMMAQKYEGLVLEVSKTITRTDKDPDSEDVFVEERGQLVNLNSKNEA